MSDYPSFWESRRLTLNDFRKRGWRRDSVGSYSGDGGGRENVPCTLAKVVENAEKYGCVPVWIVGEIVYAYSREGEYLAIRRVEKSE